MPRHICLRAAFGLAFPFMLALGALSAAPSSAEPVVKLGVDVLKESGFEALRGQRVGLVANPASVAGDLTSTVDVLHRGAEAHGYTMVALFGPEHGVYGDEYAGDKVDDRTDRRTGLPVRSLYGATRKPTAEMLDDIDTLVFDLQDIGSRSYTYISTMQYCLEACAEQGKRFVVLDRPNPLGGLRIEGPGVTEKFRSFISLLDVPYVHGMTMGELAQLVRAQKTPDYDGLVVIAMQGLTRDMTWQDTGLAWTPTSPHIPTAASAFGYAATGVIGELGLVSNGVGYTLPFEIVGAPDVDPDDLTDAMNAQDLAGIQFRAARFKPFYATNQGEACGGVQVHFEPDAQANLFEVNFRLAEALDFRKRLRGHERVSGFDKAVGSDQARRWLGAGRDMAPLFERWRAEAEAFRQAREPYLLYD
ncbi:MAG: DUF1343 domain-containing protein [Planctomycetota bacterium]